MLAAQQFSAQFHQLIDLSAHTTCPLLASECIEIGKLVITGSCTEHMQQAVAHLRAACTAVLGKLADQRPNLHSAVMQPLLVTSAVSGLFGAVAQHTSTICRYRQHTPGLQMAELMLLVGSRHDTVRLASWKALLALLTSGEC